MHAIILAAGVGRRLAPMGWDKPKCLLEFGGRTLLTRTLDALTAHGIHDVAIVVGYRQLLIRGSVGDHARITWIDNPDFATTNTVHSLWLARAFLNDDVVLCNADVLFDAGILGDLMAVDGAALAIHEKPCGEEEVKVSVDVDDRIMRIGKSLPPDGCLGEFIGVGALDRPAAMALAVALRRYNEGRTERDLFYEAALDDMAADCVLRAVRLSGHRAVEIDTPEDVTTARRLFSA